MFCSSNCFNFIVIFIFLNDFTQRCHFLCLNIMTVHSMVAVLFVCKLWLGKYFCFDVTSTILFVEIELYSQRCLYSLRKLSDTNAGFHVCSLHTRLHVCSVSA